MRRGSGMSLLAQHEHTALRTAGSGSVPTSSEMQTGTGAAHAQRMGYTVLASCMAAAY